MAVHQQNDEFSAMKCKSLQIQSGNPSKNPLADSKTNKKIITSFCYGDQV